MGWSTCSTVEYTYYCVCSREDVMDVIVIPVYPSGCGMVTPWVLQAQYMYCAVLNEQHGMYMQSPDRKSVV